MAFFFTLLFMFLVFWRPQEWLVPWLFGWPLLNAIFVFAVAAYLIELDSGMAKLPRRAPPQVLLLIGLNLAAIFSHVPHTYLQGIIDTIEPVTKICIFSILLILVLSNVSRLMWVARVFVVMACFMCIHAQLQQSRGYGFAYGVPVFVPQINENPPFLRSQFFGIFADPNDMAQIFATSLPFAFVLFKRRTIATVLIGLAASWYLIEGIGTTHSRGGQVALVATLGMLSLQFFPKKWMPVLMVGSVIGGLMLTPFAGAFLDRSAHNRVIFWGYANEAFKSNIMFGVGYGMFWTVIPSSDMTAHNAFVYCYTTIGFVGYWFWYGLLQVGLIGCWRIIIRLRGVKGNDAQYVKRFAMAAMAGTMGFSASAYFLSRTFLYPFFFLFSIMGALPLIAQRYLPPETRPLISFKRDALFWGSVGAAGSIVYIYLSIVFLNRAWFG